jgi:exopolysaccharide biosynthesis polyprenyl glycosylphosphotransferase
MSGPDPFAWPSRALKRALDVVLAAIAIGLLLPAMIAIGILIKLDTKGAVFFRQTRYGRSRAPFKIWKFCTMTVMEDGAVVTQARQHDPRVTRIGRFLRRTSLDELPQLFNVFMGEMSLVGPRPHARAHDDYYASLIDNYCWRQNVKPGLTGWAQINGHRGETRNLDQMRKRVDFDIWYIKHFNLALDIIIMARTIRVVVRGDAAY